MCHLHDCVSCAETDEFYERRWCCRMCKSVGSTKLGLDKLFFHVFVDSYVNSELACDQSLRKILNNFSNRFFFCKHVLLTQFVTS